MRWSLDGRVAVVTGAASGIGRALAGTLAARGCRLSLCDVDEAGLAATRAEASVRGAEVHAQILDVRDRDVVGAYADAVAERFGAVHVVVNNAGVAAVARAEALTPDDMDWVMDVNFWGVVHGSQAFLPHLRRADAGQLVNISSVFGLVAAPGHAIYNASKFAVRGFTEALALELRMEGASVSVTCVHPGGVATGIAESARISDVDDLLGPTASLVDDFRRRAARLSPERAAEIITRGIERRRQRVLVGHDARALDLTQRLLPSAHQRLTAGLARKFRDRAGTRT